jgi:hypothetical protein
MIQLFHRGSVVSPSLYPRKLDMRPSPSLSAKEASNDHLDRSDISRQATVATISRSSGQSQNWFRAHLRRCR